MTGIKKSELLASAFLSAAVVVSDERWDQWQRLMQSEFAKRGVKTSKWRFSEDKTYYLVEFLLSPEEAKVKLGFEDSGSGRNYELKLLEVEKAGARSGSRNKVGKMPKTGKELIEQIISLASSQKNKPKTAIKVGGNVFEVPAEFDVKQFERLCKQADGKVQILPPLNPGDRDRYMLYVVFDGLDITSEDLIEEAGGDSNLRIVFSLDHRGLAKMDWFPAVVNSDWKPVYQTKRFSPAKRMAHIKGFIPDSDFNRLEGLYKQLQKNFTYDR